MSDAAKPTRASSARKSPDLAICPHCGRMFVVTPGGVCPHCGFPLVNTLERTPTAARAISTLLLRGPAAARGLHCGNHGPQPRGAGILVPTDFSSGAEEAMRWAEALGAAFGAKVTLMHVLDLSIAGAAGLSTQVAAMPALGALMEQMPRRGRDGDRGAWCSLPFAKTIVREGIPRSAILEVAAETGADLIVMGTRGRTGLVHVFFGSVAECVVRHSRVPVLTVRRQGE